MLNATVWERRKLHAEGKMLNGKFNRVTRELPKPSEEAQVEFQDGFNDLITSLTTWGEAVEKYLTNGDATPTPDADVA